MSMMLSTLLEQQRLLRNIMLVCSPDLAANLLLGYLEAVKASWLASLPLDGALVAFP